MIARWSIVRMDVAALIVGVLGTLAGILQVAFMIADRRKRRSNGPNPPPNGPAPTSPGAATSYRKRVRTQADGRRVLFRVYEGGKDKTGILVAWAVMQLRATAGGVTSAMARPWSDPLRCLRIVLVAAPLFAASGAAQAEVVAEVTGPDIERHGILPNAAANDAALTYNKAVLLAGKTGSADAVMGLPKAVRCITCKGKTKGSSE